MSDREASPAPVASVSLIAALANNGVIGRDNALPWRLPDDLKRFKALTLGKTVVMGRLTFESIGKALPGRENLVLTRNRDWQADGCRVFRDVHSALAATAGKELMVIGGAQIYAQTIALAQRLYLTHVNADIEGDARFPPIDARDWRVVEQVHHGADARHAHDFRFVDYERC